MSCHEPQRSEAWFDARAGRITASRMCDVMAFSPGGEYKSGKRKGQPKEIRPLKARTDYIHQLAAERLTGKPRRQVKAPALQWGQSMEPEALAAYQAETGDIVTPAGFMLHPLHDFVGASPDFLVNDDGGGEIKCPESSEVHLATLLQGLPPEHIEQIQGGLWVTSRHWWDFVSFHPEFPSEHQLYVQRVLRDDSYIAKLSIACQSLEEEVQAILNKLQKRDAAQ
jgi:hypothetical protein